MNRFLSLVVVVVLLLCSTLAARAETVVVPVGLERKLVETIYLEQVFGGPGQVATVVNENEGCRLLELSEPEIGQEDGMLRLRAKLKVRAGLAVGGECRLPVAWEGTVEGLQKILVDVPDWKLRFKTVDSRFYGRDGKSSKITGSAWNLVKERLHDHLDRPSLDLSANIRAIEETLPLFFSGDDRQAVLNWLSSLRPGLVEIRPEEVSVPLLMEVSVPEQAPELGKSEEPLTAAELSSLTQSLETLDAFLTFQVLQLGSYGLSLEEKMTLLDVLLDARHRLVDFLTVEQPRSSEDAVRRQFVQTWDRVAPFFRRYQSARPGEGVGARLNLLAFLAAGDALAALDRIGPGLGLEISRDGLLRLARLLVDEGIEVDLSYSFDVDPQLRSFFGLATAAEPTGPVWMEEELDWPAGPGEADDDPFPSALLRFLFPVAIASELTPPDPGSLKHWLVERATYDSYLDKVEQLVREEAGKIAGSGPLGAERLDFFTGLMLATAWQESCFRQFVVDKGKLTFLRSWSNTSVGLMQVNERVWRGFYRVDGLRWDPRYNVWAGGEILHTYLVNYGLKKEKSGALAGDDDLARAAYAMYNGGPGQLGNFLARHAKNSYLPSDKLFWNKYKWVREDELHRVRQCLFGG